MKISSLKIAVASIFLALPYMVQAEETPSFQSAHFAFDGQDLLSKVTTKSIAEKGDVLYCRADIAVDGSAERASCYAKDTSIELVVDTESAIQSLPFTAAQVEGKSVPVRMSFRVAYVPSDTGTHVALIPNLGTMQAQYGRDYIAPQERLDVSDWYERYSNNSWIGGQEFLGEGDISRVSATVSATGSPSQIRTLAAKKAHARDADIVKRTLKYSRFVPGTSNGRVVPMQYLVAVHYEESGQSVANAK